MPPFWSGLMILFVLYYQLKLLPGPGRIDTRMIAPPTVTGLHLVDSLLANDMAAFTNSLQHLILPSIILGWFTLAQISRITRSSLLEVLRMDYIRTARAKGLHERTVILAHALRNAFIPTLTVMGLAFAGLMSGAIMTETIFAWPGIGRLFIQSMYARDYPVLMGILMMGSFMVVFFNLLADLVYGWLDPRISYQ